MVSLLLENGAKFGALSSPPQKEGGMNKEATALELVQRVMEGQVCVWGQGRRRGGCVRLCGCRDGGAGERERRRRGGCVCVRGVCA